PRELPDQPRRRGRQHDQVQPRRVRRGTRPGTSPRSPRCDLSSGQPRRERGGLFDPDNGREPRLVLRQCERALRLPGPREHGGKEPFGFLVNEEPFREVPGCLEFPGRDAGYKKNLKTLRSLVTGPNPPTSPRAPGGKRGDRGTA